MACAYVCEAAAAAACGIDGMDETWTTTMVHKLLRAITVKFRCCTLLWAYKANKNQLLGKIVGKCSKIKDKKI